MRKTLLFIVALVGFAGIAQAVPGIAGYVRDAETRQPIAGALVACDGGSARTGRDGRYLIDGLEPGRYRVRCEASGYEPAVFPEPVVVTRGQITDNVNFRLEAAAGRYGAISGMVRDRASREVIVGAVVSVSSGRFRRSVTQTERGYRVAQLPAGRYWVSATARGYAPGSFPESVLVAVGRITEYVDFGLASKAGRTGGIAGFVRNARNREPIVGARVAAKGPDRGKACTNREGKYAIRGLRPGRYHVLAAARGFRRAAPVAVEVVAGRITRDVNFALEPERVGSGVIVGFVRDTTTGSGIPGAKVLAAGRAGQGRARTGPRGYYSISELSTGRYVVRAGAHRYYHKRYPRVISVAEGETTRVSFLLRPFRPDVAGIGGFIFDGVSQEEVAGAHVSAVGAGGSLDVLADEYGDFVFEGIEPGTYDLQVTAEGYGSGSDYQPVVVEAGTIAEFTCLALYPTSEPELWPTDEVDEHSATVSVRNPVRGRAIIRYNLTVPIDVRLDVYDGSGRRVTTLAAGARDVGNHEAIWDATGVSAGVYICRLTTSAGSVLGKAVVVSR